MTRIYWSKRAERRIQERYRTLLNYWPVAHEELRFPTCQGETFVLACGSPQAPPLVLFHGGLSNSLMWLRNVRAWTEHFRIYCVDTIGDPGFSAPSRPSFQTDAHTRWLDDVWRALSLTRVAVVGWSLGGWLGMNYAIRRPGSIGPLVLLAPAGIVRMRPSGVLKVLSLTLMGAWGRRKAFFLSMGLQDEAMTAEARVFIDFSLLAQTALIGRTKLPSVFTDEMLRSLKMPVLLVAGERDIFFDAQAAKTRFAACVSQSAVHYLRDAGHGLIDPTRIVLDFLLANRSSEAGLAQAGAKKLPCD